LETKRDKDMSGRKEIETILFLLKEWINDLENHLTHAKMAVENIRKEIINLEEIIKEKVMIEP